VDVCGKHAAPPNRLWKTGQLRRSERDQRGPAVDPVRAALHDRRPVRGVEQAGEGGDGAASRPAADQELGPDDLVRSGAWAFQSSIGTITTAGPRCVQASW